MKVLKNMTWRNWARTETSKPEKVIFPSTVLEIQKHVEEAAENNSTIKAVGASHSFTGVAATDGVHIDMSRMSGIVGYDAKRKRASFLAGTHLWQLPKYLDQMGLALPNMGDIDAQTISGATQTGTHGTGLQFTGLANMIVGMTVIDGNGKIVTIDESEPEVLRAAALGLGSIGIVITVTLQLVPKFLLHAEEAPAKLADVLTDYVDTSREVDHFEFYWFPHTKTVRTKTNTRLPVDAERKPLNPVSKWLDEEFVNNDLLGAVLKFGHHLPAAVPRINNLIESVSSKRSYTDDSYRVFVTSRRVRFKETEFAIPMEAIPDAMRDINRMIERKKMLISFPLEVRNAKADDLYLSTAYKRETGYIAAHRFYKDDEQEYFKELWSILRLYEGRPHWGKMNDFDENDVAAAYPQLDSFLKVRNKFDPHRVFNNHYLNRILGK